MIETGGRWSRRDANVYFIAGGGGPLTFGCACHPFLLVALNELSGQDARAKLLALLDAGKSVFIDSGVFALSMRHAEKHGLDFYDALGVAPQNMDGFAQLFDDYCNLMHLIGDRVWGYIEIDQGGRENKIKTRALLEEKGLRPIPVYHPLSDGWDYFDYLASRYDRICFGNVVQSEPEERKRMLATAWERKQRYPHLWVHMLGLTPSENCNAYPIDSCDSSTWLALVRWPSSYSSHCALQRFSPMPVNFTYRLGAESDSEHGHEKAWRLGGYEAAMLTRNWRALQADYAAALESGGA